MKGCSTRNGKLNRSACTFIPANAADQPCKPFGHLPLCLFLLMQCHKWFALDICHTESFAHLVPPVIEISAFILLLVADFIFLNDFSHLSAHPQRACLPVFCQHAMSKYLAVLPLLRQKSTANVKAHICCLGTFTFQHQAKQPP